VFAGRDEAELLGHAGAPLNQARALQEMGPRTVVVTRGEEGACVLSDDRAHDQPAFRVRAVDPVGAGDAFVAGFLADWVLDLPIEQCAETGARCGAMVAATEGDWEGQPTRQELLSLDRVSHHVGR
jgi:2-dehydro-3-deoxygluconokinase